MPKTKQMLYLSAFILGAALVSSGCATQPKEAEPAPEEEAEPMAEEEKAPEAEEAEPEQAQMAEPEEKRVANGVLRAVPGASEGTYTVGRGDNLWNIAAADAIYGDPFAWPLIYKHNSGKIEDADLIYPDQELLIRWDVSSAAFDAAVRHARTRGAWRLGETEASDLEYLRSN